MELSSKPRDGEDRKPYLSCLDLVLSLKVGGANQDKIMKLLTQRPQVTMNCSRLGADNERLQNSELSTIGMRTETQNEVAMDRVGVSSSRSGELLPC